MEFFSARNPTISSSFLFPGQNLTATASSFDPRPDWNFPSPLELPWPRPVREKRKRPINTQDFFGIVHVESTVVRDYTLGEFFKIWGKTFNTDCIQADKLHCNVCGSLSMVVNRGPEQPL